VSFRGPPGSLPNDSLVGFFIIMKENKDLIEHLGKEWGKFWLNSGTEVYHRNMIAEDSSLKDGSFVMIVDQVVKRSVEHVDPKQPKPFRIVGIKCHWFSNGKFESGLFHSKELIPANVVDKGMLEDWLKR